MANIVEYARSCRDTFAERPLCRVDSLVLSCLSYLWLPEEVPASTTVEGVALIDLDDAKMRLSLTAPVGNGAKHEQLIAAAATNPRFFNVRACLSAERSDDELERQFAAVTFRLPTGEHYVAFRGTDNTLLGWKEDFNMAFRNTVPAQEAARDYLNAVAAQVEGPLIVGGHSKGGNLAVFAAMTCDPLVRSRITLCYNHDGPDFTDEVVASPEWANAWELVEKTVPGESLIGLLLGSHGQDPIIVQSSREGVLQHDPFSWVVEGNDFAREKALSYDAYRTGKRVNGWLREKSVADRERFVDILYRVVRSSGEVTFSGLVHSLGDGSLSLMLKRLDGLPEADREFFVSTLSDLAATILLGPAPKTPVTPAEKAAAAVEKVDDITAKFNDTMARWEKYFG